MQGHQVVLRALVIFLLLAVAEPAVRSQTTEDELRAEIEALKQGQEEIRTELQEINRLLRRPAQRSAPAARSVEGQVFELGQNPVRGDDSAPLTLIEFLDFQ